MSVRVRFAPSPTGPLHIGGARTALFNWLFARHNKGTFILRIEDTDRERSLPEHTKSIMDGMKWLQMNFDEGPIFQSERMEHYVKAVDSLLASGKAYRCYCTAEELEQKRQAALARGDKPMYDRTCREKTDKSDKPFVVRLKSPLEGKTDFMDVCRGPIEFFNKELDDLIILRSDGTPTYNLTVVVDDVDMNITHVIRGDDHINNTPRQILLYQALNYPVPQFAHLPMIYGSDKKKLSKRHGATSVVEYEQMGFLPEAMVNYLSRLGWSSGDQEIFTIAELAEKFRIEAVGSSPSIFDMEKLMWVNSQHMLKKSDAELVEASKPFLTSLGVELGDPKFAARAIHSERERAKTLKELAELSAFYFRKEIELDPASAEKWLDDEHKKILHMIREKLNALSDFTEKNIEPVFKSLLEETGKKMVDLAQPCRVALTGKTFSPGIYEVMSILGKQEVLKRIDSALARK